VAATDPATGIVLHRSVFYAGSPCDHCQRPAPVSPASGQTSLAAFAFDVTPAKLVTGFITERGVCKASEKDILNLFPEKRVSI